MQKAPGLSLKSWFLLVLVGPIKPVEELNTVNVIMSKYNLVQLNDDALAFSSEFHCSPAKFRQPLRVGLARTAYQTGGPSLDRLDSANMLHQMRVPHRTTILQRWTYQTIESSSNTNRVLRVQTIFVLDPEFCWLFHRSN